MANRIDGIRTVLILPDITKSSLFKCGRIKIKERSITEVESEQGEISGGAV